MSKYIIPARRQTAHNSELNSYNYKVYDYEETAVSLFYLIGKCNETTCEEERIDYTIQIFDILINNPNILICEPVFRKAIEYKSKQLQKYIINRIYSYNKEHYVEQIKTLALSINSNVCNSHIRNKINGYFTDIITTLKEYEVWHTHIQLLKRLNEINCTLESIKLHPYYIH